jgi:hypothetical protein
MENILIVKPSSEKEFELLSQMLRKMNISFKKTKKDSLTTIEAIEELKNDKGKKFKTVEGAMKFLNS